MTILVVLIHLLVYLTVIRLVDSTIDLLIKLVMDINCINLLMVIIIIYSQDITKLMLADFIDSFTIVINTKINLNKYYSFIVAFIPIINTYNYNLHYQLVDFWGLSLLTISQNYINFTGMLMLILSTQDNFASYMAKQSTIEDPKAYFIRQIQEHFSAPQVSFVVLLYNP